MWAGVLLVACGTETAGESIRFEASAAGLLEGSDTPPTQFVTAEGWEVQLSTARVMIGPMFLYGGSLRASRDSPGWRGLLGIARAYAHPADDGLLQGPVLGDVLDQYVIDLLSDSPTQLGVVPGVRGVLTNAELHMQPPGFSALGSPADALADMNGQTFVLEGSARLGEQEIRFRAEGHLGEETSNRIVGNIPANVELVDASDRPGRLMIAVRVNRWFDLVDFSSVAQQQSDDVLDLMSDPSHRAGLQRGIRSRFAYSPQWIAR